MKIAMQIPLKMQSPSSAFTTAPARAYITSTLRTPVALLDDLTESALHLKQTGAHEQLQPPTSGQTAGNTLKTFVPNFFVYRPSRSAAQVFLNKDGGNGNKDNNNNLRDQSEIDHLVGAERNELSLVILATMMQLAKGLGDSDHTAALGTIDRGRNKLCELLGKGQADWVFERMESWSANARRQTIIDQPDDAIELESRVTSLAQQAISSDSQIANLRASMAVYDRAPGYLDRGLSAAGLTPTLIGPAAKAAQYAVEYGSGGSRVKRLSDVLAMGMTMQDRVNNLTRQSEMALNNLERARLSNNPVLYAFSKDLIGKLGGTR